MIFSLLNNNYKDYSKSIKRVLLLSTSINEELSLEYYKSFVVYLQSISYCKAALFTNLTFLKILQVLKYKLSLNKYIQENNINYAIKFLKETVLAPKFFELYFVCLNIV